MQNTKWGAAGATCLASGVLALGAGWVVEGTLHISREIGLAASTIAFTATAIGTSLPELIVSVVAAWRRQAGIAIGNAIGSNIFNLTAVLGLSAVAGELEFDAFGFTALALAALSGLCLTGLLLICGSQRINRSGGLLLIAVYAVFAVQLME